MTCTICGKQLAASGFIEYRGKPFCDSICRYSYKKKYEEGRGALPAIAQGAPPAEPAARSAGSSRGMGWVFAVAGVIAYALLIWLAVRDRGQVHGAFLGVAGMLLGVGGWSIPFRWNPLRLKRPFANLLSDEANAMVPKVLGSLLIVIGVIASIGSLIFD
jgi:hypothetical protein